MNDAMMLKKFASDLCEALPIMTQMFSNHCDMLVKQASAVDALKKEASAAKQAAVKFDSAKLYKAASAVQKLFGGSLSTEQLYAVYNSNPNALVDSLYKTASHQVGATVSSGSLGTVRNIKKEDKSLETEKHSAESAWHNIFNK
jgi:hypothetical protein